MHALSIKQPWAWLIVNGYKDIENRSWQTTFRGQVLIHASKTTDPCPFTVETQLRMGIALPRRDKIERQGIVGIATIVECVTASDSYWFEGRYGFVMEGARPLPFVPCPGALRFWRVPEHLLKEIEL